LEQTDQYERYDEIIREQLQLGITEAAPEKATGKEFYIKKAVKRLYFLKMLKGYNAPKQDLKAFYIAVIRSTLEYCAQIWHGNLTKEQSTDIERVQKRALRIICPGLTYEEALLDCNLKTLKARREEMCGNLIKTMIDPRHSLHSLLPETVKVTEHL
jgi:hypothetical protein